MPATGHPRLLAAEVRRCASVLPAVTVTGPRQSGKTTLCRATFPDKPYFDLDDQAARELVASDPRGFLERLPNGAILDEVQRAPDLSSYLKVAVDQRRRNGEWILSGSHNLGLLSDVSQSLAGRTAILNLLPLGLDELRAFPGAPTALADVVFAGAFPRIHDQRVPPDVWFSAYVATYLERDVRQLTQVGDLLAFHAFLKLCAGRSAQILNLSSLASDVGVAPNTIKAWISTLEASFIAFRLPPLTANWNRRLIRAPKLYLVDSGLACHLLGMRASDQLETHPLRGPLFETWVVSEIVKARVHRGLRDGLWFYRDRSGHEVDLVVERARDIVAVEIKSGQTVHPDHFDPLARFAGLARRGPESHKPVVRVVVHGGRQREEWSSGIALPWSDVASFEWWG